MDIRKRRSMIMLIMTKTRIILVQLSRFYFVAVKRFLVPCFRLTHIWKKVR